MTVYGEERRDEEKGFGKQTMLCVQGRIAEEEL